jgi:antitoxin MazE
LQLLSSAAVIEYVYTWIYTFYNNEGPKVKTTTQVKMWGNSLAIRIPSKVARDLGLTNDGQIEITTDGSIAIIKREKSPRKSLDELVKDITPENIHDHVDWGDPVGKEIW